MVLSFVAVYSFLMHTEHQMLVWAWLVGGGPGWWVIIALRSKAVGAAVTGAAHRDGNLMLSSLINPNQASGCNWIAKQGQQQSASVVTDGDTARLPCAFARGARAHSPLRPRVL